MGVDRSSYVGHTSVTDFYRLPIENFVQGVVFRKVNVQESEELFANVSFYRSAKRGVEPDYFSSPVSSSSIS